MLKKLPTTTDIKEIIEMSLRPTWRIGIVYSTFYEEEMNVLLRGAMDTLKTLGIPEENILLYPVPGSFEIPLLGAKLAHEKSVNALIGLGIIINGETEHGRLIADSTARGMMDIQVQYRIPFAFEVLFVDSIELARQRLHKGEEAAMAAIRSLVMLQETDR